MARCPAARVDLSNTHRHRLEAIVPQHRASQALVKRARIVLTAGVRETARALGMGGATVPRWRKRWQRSE